MPQIIEENNRLNQEKGEGILIVGGGITGITAAIEAAEVGYRVILIEKRPYLGGKAIEMNQYFPKLCPPYCGMEINFKRIKNNPRITVYTSTTVKEISGTEGKFTVYLEIQPAYVNQNCTLCGDCTEVCPVDRPDSYNSGMNNTKAIYFPHDLAFPARYTIDKNYCDKNACNKCEEICSYDAIDLSGSAESIELNIGAVVYATGWEPYDAKVLKELKFGEHQDIITNMMMERMAAPNGPGRGEIYCPSNKKTPNKIAFIQCAGSRDEKYLSYCSGVCCSASIKQAINMVERYPEAEVKIFYIDLRVSGRNEDFLKKAEEHPRIEFVKGKVASININEDKPELISENIMSGKKQTSIVDLVVLATGIVPNGVGKENTLNNEEGFIMPSKLEKGIYAAGCSKRPMDISSSVKDATGVALKAIQSAL